MLATDLFPGSDPGKNQMKQIVYVPKRSQSNEGSDNVL
jgi:hypothetical protein